MKYNSNVVTLLMHLFGRDLLSQILHRTLKVKFNTACDTVEHQVNYARFSLIVCKQYSTTAKWTAFSDGTSFS